MIENMSQNALTILDKRYLLRDPETGALLEDAEGMFKRVAKYIASAETTEYDKEQFTSRFEDMLMKRDFLPNTPCLVNAGKGFDDSGLSACFVLPIEDSMDSIYQTLKDAATVFKSGGGCGYSFSRLRPKGDRVKTTGGVAGGPVSFMRLFHTMAQTVMQGSVRPGAQMAILRCDHPDIEEFIQCKAVDGELSTFNISVAITDKFMELVKVGGDWDLINPRDGEVTKTIKASDLWVLIVRMAHQTGDPGLFFIDEANRHNPTPGLGDYESTNPCGEVVLLPGEPCNLGSINLAHFVLQPSTDGYDNYLECIDIERLMETVHLAVRFLDNVITVNAYPVPLIKKMAEGNRKIGLGVMGWADMLVMLGVEYGSPTAVQLAEDVMKIIHDEAYEESNSLAISRGNFPNFGDSLYQTSGSGFDGHCIRQRNSTKLTIAPTGSISNIADCSSGIEPYFALAYERTSFQELDGVGGTKLIYFNPLLDDYLTNTVGFTPDQKQEFGADLRKAGSLKNVDGKWQKWITPHMMYLFATANDLSPEAHVRMQAAFQKWTDSSISKTINMANDATFEDVDKAYKLAYELKCKGITVYRDGSKRGQVLKVSKDEILPVEINGKVINQHQLSKIGPRPRQHAMHGTTRMIPTGCGPLVVTINSDEHGIAEVITKGGKSGGCVSAQTEAIGRLASLCMRSGVPKEKVISQLGGIQCHLPVFYPGQPQGHQRVTSCADAIATAMIEAVYELEHVVVPLKKEVMGLQGSCPDCGGVVSHESGCIKCISPECGWSKC